MGISLQKHDFSNLAYIWDCLKAASKQLRHRAAHQMSAPSSHIETYFPRCQNEQKMEDKEFRIQFYPGRHNSALNIELNYEIGIIHFSI